MQVYNVRRIVRESIFVILICVVLDLQAGVLLDLNIDTFLQWTALLLLIPSYLAMGGNIGTILGSRLTSALYLGAIEPKFLKWTKIGKENLAASLLLGLCAFFFVGMVTFVTSVFLNLSFPGVGKLLLLTLVSGFLLIACLSLLTFFTALLAFRRGLDPDNIVAPIIATSGDLIGAVIFVALLPILF
ncbi:MAG: magnesium transporter [Promethearchaeota archaeon]